MSVYPSDMDDLRRSIGEAAVLLAAAVIYAGSPRMEQDEVEAVDRAKSLLDEIRERKA